MERLSGEKIYLKPADLETWMNARIYRHTKEALEYDPYTPYQTELQEKNFYENFIETKYFLLYGIYCQEEKKLLGFINAFEFRKSNSSVIEPFKFYEEGGICETGIGLFKPENFRKGFGVDSYKVFIKLLSEKYNIKSTMIFTHPKNERAIGLYKKLGFSSYGFSMFGEYEFVKMEIKLNR